MLYEEILDDELRAYSRTYKRKVRDIANTSDPECDISLVSTYLSDMERALEDLDHIRVEPPKVNLLEQIQWQLEASLNNYKEQVSKATEEENQRIQEAEAANAQKIADAQKANNESINPLIQKHEELLTYKQTLEDLMLTYKVQQNDISIQQGLSEEEMMALLTSSIDICKKLSMKSDGSSFSSKLLRLRDSKTKEVKTYGSLGLIVVAYLACPFLFLPVAVKLITASNKSATMIDKLKIAYSAMYDYDFSVYIPEFKAESVATTDINALEEAKAQRLEDLSASDPGIELNKETTAIAQHAEEIEAQLKSAEESVRALINGTKEEIQKIVDRYRARLDEAKAACTEPGAVMCKEPVLSHKYLLSRQDDCIDVWTEIGLENIMFDSSDPKMMNFLKLMLINIITSVRARMLEVVIYDPAGMGMDFANLIVAGTEMTNYIKIQTEDFEKVKKEVRKYVQENALKLKDKSIDQYNAEAEEVGKVSLIYKLIIIVSDWDSCLKDENFKQMLINSTKLGLMTWVYGTGEKFEFPGARRYDRARIPKSEIIDVDVAMEFRVAELFKQAIDDAAVPTLVYQTMFTPRVIPPEKWWTFKTIKGIELNPGFQDGDPTKGFPIVFGDANVHALMGGASGGGKSAMINQALCTLISKYSPEELQLVMVDFKNVEFSTYANVDTGLSRLPHAKILAGTKDGEYAISIFQYLYDEMQRRTEFLSKHGEKKIEDYRKKNPDAPPIPRILVIIDEFQVMFTEVDQKSVDKIIKLIQLLSKLARFCGCHLWFTSQSMKGTLSKDILDQFSMRMMLRASADASTDILGSPVAAKMPAKFGFVWSNETAGEDPSKNILWKVPFAETTVINDIIAKLNVMADERGLGKDRALFYDEKRMYHQEDLFKWYDVKGEFFKNPYTFILGERTAYSTNNAPVNFKMTKADGEHLLVEAGEIGDILNLVMTFHDNLTKSDSNTCIMHCCDQDVHTLLAMEELVSEDFVDYTYPCRDDVEFVELLETLVQGRKEQGFEGKPPIFIFIVMGERLSFYKQENYRDGDRFLSVIKEMGVLDIHLLMFCRVVDAIGVQVRNQFSHRLAAKCSEKLSYTIIDDSKAVKLPRGDDDGYFAIYKYSDQMDKFKIYQHVFTRKLESRTVSF